MINGENNSAINDKNSIDLLFLLILKDHRQRRSSAAWDTRC